MIEPLSVYLGYPLNPHVVFFDYKGKDIGGLCLIGDAFGNEYDDRDKMEYVGVRMREIVAGDTGVFGVNLEVIERERTILAHDIPKFEEISRQYFSGMKPKLIFSVHCNNSRRYQL